MVKNILGRIFALWALCVFALTLLIILIPVWALGFASEPKRTIYIFRIFHVWMSVFFFLAGVRRIFRGREHFKKGETYIVVCNHRSFMDVPLSSPGIPGPNKTIAKMEMARIPLFGVIYKSGSVLVDRKNEESRRSSYTRMKEVLQLGLHMCIYPEGTRNKTSAPLQKFKDGAFRLATDTGKAIIPALIFHTSRVLPTHRRFFFWPHRVEMHFLPPVPVEGKSAQALRDEVHDIMYNYYVSHQ